MKQHFYCSLLLWINWKMKDKENGLLYQRYLKEYDIFMDQIWWNFSFGLKLGTWGSTWAHFKVGFRWYCNSLKKYLELPLSLTCMVEGIVEWRFLSPLCWKRGDIVRNKSYHTSASWLASPVDLFTSLHSLGEIIAFSGDRERWEEKIDLYYICCTYFKISWLLILFWHFCHIKHFTFIWWNLWLFLYGSSWCVVLRRRFLP